MRMCAGADGAISQSDAQRIAMDVVRALKTEHTADVAGDDNDEGSVFLSPCETPSPIGESVHLRGIAPYCLGFVLFRIQHFQDFQIPGLGLHFVAILLT